MSFADMKAYLAARGDSERQEMIYDGKQLVNARLRCDPSYMENAVVKRFCPESETSLGLCLYNEEMTVSDGVTADFSCAAGSDIDTGDIVYFPDEKKYRLVTHCSEKGGIIKSGKMTLCQTFLKWQDSSGTVREYPASARSAAYYTDGVTAAGMIPLGASKYVLCLPADGNTISIRRGLRFFLDRNENCPAVYKITQCDTASLCFGRGIVRLTAAEDEFRDETDSIPLWLCDVRTPEPEPGDIAVTPDDGILRTGMSRKFTAAADSVTFTLSAASSGIALTQDTENSCVISAQNDESLVGETAVLRAQDGSGRYGELRLTVRGGV